MQSRTKLRRQKASTHAELGHDFAGTLHMSYWCHTALTNHLLSQLNGSFVEYEMHSHQQQFLIELIQQNP